MIENVRFPSCLEALLPIVNRKSAIFNSSLCLCGEKSVFRMVVYLPLH
jgi:hypothetical protein